MRKDYPQNMENKGTVKIKYAGYYVNEKEKYQDKIIDYPESPTGKAFIGIAKTPLMPNVKGHGYQGVLLQDENRQLIQCSNCGKWLKKISAPHIFKCSEGRIQDTQEYKEVFGLYPSTGLVSDETSLMLTQNCLLIKDKKNAWTIATRPKFNHKKVGHFTSIREHQNRTGSCPEQLKYRLREFILRNRELPNYQNKGSALYKALYRRYKNIGNAMSDFGLPHLVKKGTTYLFTFPKSETVRINLNEFDSRETLFEKMVMECNLFSESDREFYLLNKPKAHARQRSSNK